ncbi:hypothetical protein P175DRAFT_043954 [Aspergillus ochraceoroseus IBT 24754]|uniref:Uncharacterized protein n=1 Tax=Aspergillus ochraceoroseus IBT 24754 TaxID=1392256 RepID=A0A2T5M803_9EURO|nr:uncharacterized protein P175DRAFT_043954 [Aspergillus ochraceoroseus IBT 24754]PTU24669.1 hypothetical protein P175DRAFT_043954 [Aspergillus ochraceoroseus IBT 24754]
MILMFGIWTGARSGEAGVWLWSYDSESRAVFSPPPLPATTQAQQPGNAPLSLHLSSHPHPLFLFHPLIWKPHASYLCGPPDSCHFLFFIIWSVAPPNPLLTLFNGFCLCLYRFNRHK